MNSVESITREAYDKLPRANFSKLKHLLKSPAHYRAALIAPPKEDTDAMQLGRVTHVATYEPELYAANVAIWDGGRRAGKEWDAFCKANRGREVITQSQDATARAIAQAVRADSVAARYVNGGKAEQTLLWTHLEDGTGSVPGLSVDCKGRPDFIANAGALVDLKTTKDGSPEGFGRSCWNFRYHTQAAFYVDGYAAATGKVLPYVILAVESSEPHIVQVYRLTDDVLNAGREEYRRLLRMLDACSKESNWPGYGEGELSLSLPRWALPEDSVEGLDLKFN